MENKRVLAGRPVEADAPHIRRRQGMFATMGTEFSLAAQDVGRIWGSYFDEQQQAITPEEAEEIIGPRKIEYRQGETPAALQRRVAYYDMDEFRAGTERTAGAEVAGFVASIPPYIADPINLALMPVGAGRMAAAQTSRTFTGYMRNATVAGAQVGVASAPLELAQFTAVRGQFDPAAALTAALAPVPMMPALGALPWFRNQNFNAKLSDDLTRQMGIGANDIPAATRALQTADVGSPPIRAISDDPDVTPQARMKELFDDYEGGPQAFIRGVAEGSPQARAWAERHGVDLESPAIRDLLDTLRTRAQALPGPLDGMGMRLPKGLRGAAPRSGADRLAFLSDVDRALYIATRSNPDGTARMEMGNRQEPYVTWLIERVGLNEEQIAELGAAVRREVRGRSANSGARVEIPPVAARSDRARTARAEQELTDAWAEATYTNPTPQRMRELEARIDELEATLARVRDRSPGNIVEPEPEELMRALYVAGMEKAPPRDLGRPSDARLAETLDQDFSPQTREALELISNRPEARGVVAAYNRVLEASKRCFDE